MPDKPTSAVIAARRVPAIVLVHRKPLIDPWRLQPKRCLGLPSMQMHCTQSQLAASGLSDDGGHDAVG